MMNTRHPLAALSISLALGMCAFGAHAADDSAGSPPDDSKVILVIADGARWQDVFRGADADMMTTANGVKNPDSLLRLYDAPTTEARRAKLMPFLWSHVVQTGQIYGNRDKGSVMRVANDMWFSYPGYNELLCGYPDDERVNSNDKVNNPNVSVFEWLAAKPAFKGSVVALGAWDAFPFIFNAERCGFPVDGGDKPFNPPAGVTCGMEMLNKIRETTPYRWSAAFDSLVFPMFAEYLKHAKPRAAFLCLGEPDEWGHESDYGQYLRSLHQADKWLKETWELVQSMPEYRGKTTMIFGADHGRGSAPKDPKSWNGHGRKTEGSDAVFMAIWGPNTPPRGEVAGGAEVRLSQIAASVAVAVGQDYPREQPKAAPAVAGAFSGAATAAE